MSFDNQNLPSNVVSMLRVDSITVGNQVISQSSVITLKQGDVFYINGGSYNRDISVKLGDNDSTIARLNVLSVSNNQIMVRVPDDSALVDQPVNLHLAWYDSAYKVMHRYDTENPPSGKPAFSFRIIASKPAEPPPSPRILTVTVNTPSVGAVITNTSGEVTFGFNALDGDSYYVEVLYSTNRSALENISFTPTTGGFTLNNASSLSRFSSHTLSTLFRGNDIWSVYFNITGEIFYRILFYKTVGVYFGASSVRSFTLRRPSPPPPVPPSSNPTVVSSPSPPPPKPATIFKTIIHAPSSSLRTKNPNITFNIENDPGRVTRYGVHILFIPPEDSRSITAKINELNNALVSRSGNSPRLNLPFQVYANDLSNRNIILFDPGTGYTQMTRFTFTANFSFYLIGGRVPKTRTGTYYYRIVCFDGVIDGKIPAIVSASDVSSFYLEEPFETETQIEKIIQSPPPLPLPPPPRDLSYRITGLNSRILELTDDLIIYGDFKELVEYEIGTSISVYDANQKVYTYSRNQIKELSNSRIVLPLNNLSNFLNIPLYLVIEFYSKDTSKIKNTQINLLFFGFTFMINPPPPPRPQIVINKISKSEVYIGDTFDVFIENLPDDFIIRLIDSDLSLKNSPVNNNNILEVIAKNGNVVTVKLNKKREGSWPYFYPLLIQVEDGNINQRMRHATGISKITENKIIILPRVEIRYFNLETSSEIYAGDRVNLKWDIISTDTELDIISVPSSEIINTRNIKLKDEKEIYFATPEENEIWIVPHIPKEMQGISRQLPVNDNAKIKVNVLPYEPFEKRKVNLEGKSQVFTRFKDTDIIENEIINIKVDKYFYKNKDKLDRIYFNNDPFSIENQFHVKVYSEPDLPGISKENYYEFAIAYGNFYGYGSITNDLKFLPTRAVYFQVLNLLMPPKSEKIAFPDGKILDDFILISFKRKSHDLNKVVKRKLKMFYDFNNDIIDTIDVENFLQGYNNRKVYNLKHSANLNNKYVGLYLPEINLIILNPDYYNFINNIQTARTSINTFNIPLEFIRYYHMLINSFETDNEKGFLFKIESIYEIKVRHFFINLEGSAYNYTSNESFYIKNQENVAIIRNEAFIHNPQVFITTIGLYNDYGELIAVGKLSKPLLKNFATEYSIIMNLQY